MIVCTFLFYSSYSFPSRQLQTLPELICTCILFKTIPCAKGFDANDTNESILIFPLKKTMPLFL